VRTSTPRTHHGVLLGATATLVAVRVGAGLVLVPLGAVSALRVGEPTPEVEGEARTETRAGPTRLRLEAGLLAVLADLSDEQPAVELTLRGDAEPVRGRLVAAGPDVVHVVAAGPGTRSMRWAVSAHALSEVLLPTVSG